METCREIMTQTPRVCLPTSNLREAAQIMRDEDVGAVPIVEDYESKRLVGILTDRDIALKVAAGGSDPDTTKIDVVMTETPLACKADDSVEEALQIMSQHQIRRLPVVDVDFRLVGIIAQSDVARRLDKPEKTAEVVKEISEPN